MKKILLSLLMLCGMTSAWAQDDDFVEVDTTIKLWEAIQANNSAKVRLTADFALSDIDKDYETYCSTFSGILDGNGHTIKGDPVADIRARTYMFTYCDGATIKNLTFKGIRIDNRKNHNQAVITSQAKNGCVFENITFDHISTYVGDEHDNTGAVAGYATTNCTFKNITVKNSDFTADNCQSGAVVGHAMNCTFTNIKVENCESTSRNSYSGGVAGRTDNCTINNVEILGSFIKTRNFYVGGVVGHSENTHFTNCVVDDQSCVCVDGNDYAYAGGITGYGKKTTISNCINSALIAADNKYAGGIVGTIRDNSNVVGCLNTGMVIAIQKYDVENGFYNKYKTKSGMTCVTKTYQGKEYVIRKYEATPRSSGRFGGIAGSIEGGNVSKCVNFGSVYCATNKLPYGYGGIVGLVENGTISDCLSDFSCSNGIFGICEFEGNGVSVNNCLNMTTYKDISAHEGTWGDFKGEHNYSLTTAEDAHHTTKTTAAKIKSGQICYLLGEAWEQHLDIDPYPTPTGNRGLYYTRTVNNEYGTVCLPFALESNEDITYYRFNPDVKNEDGSVVLEFRKTETVLAGEPALFRASKTGELTFSNAGNTYSDLPHNTAMVDVPWAIFGVYEQQVFDENTLPNSDHVYYLSNGVFRNAKKITIAPYRAWIGGPRYYELPGSAQAKAITLVLAGENGETTALELVGEDLVPVQQGAKSYSLMGTEVGEGYRGLVIRNGKKVIQNR